MGAGEPVQSRAVLQGVRATAVPKRRAGSIRPDRMRQTTTPALRAGWGVFCLGSELHHHPEKTLLEKAYHNSEVCFRDCCSVMGSW